MNRSWTKSAVTRGGDGGVWLLPSGGAVSPLGWVSIAANAVASTRPTRGRPWRWLGSYALVLINRGQGRYTDEHGADRGLGPGDLVVVLPERGHHYGPAGGGWVESYLVFSGPVFELWESAGLFEALGPVRSLGRPDHWRQRFAWVTTDANRSGPAVDSTRHVARLQVLLAELVAEARGQDSSVMPRPAGAEKRAGAKGGDWLAQAVEALEGDLETWLDLEALAQRCGVSYSTFRRRLTRDLGVSPARYRAARVIDHARQLMLATHLSDKEIAARLNFADPHHFSHRFKQLAGQTPSQYRQSLR